MVRELCWANGTEASLDLLSAQETLNIDGKIIEGEDL